MPRSSYGVMSRGKILGRGLNWRDYHQIVPPHQHSYESPNSETYNKGTNQSKTKKYSFDAPRQQLRDITSKEYLYAQVGQNLEETLLKKYRCSCNLEGVATWWHYRDIDEIIL